VTIAHLLERMRGLRILIVGDLCLDRWCHYSPQHAEKSRETGIDRIAVVQTSVTPGAAGTIAGNLTALGVGHVGILSVIGDDGYGYELSRALSARHILSEHCIRSPLVDTFTYTKLINASTGVEDLPRVDFINTADLPWELEQQVSDRFERIASFYHLIIVSDQAETERGGVVTPAVREAICRHAGANPGQLYWVDSRVRPEHFRGVVVKPNKEEAEAASRRVLGRVDLPALRERMGCPLLAITLGAEGVMLIDRDGVRTVPAGAVANPVDICGAGDSFTAAAAPALYLSGSAEEAARFGNLVASITIMKPGTGTASAAEVLAKAGEA
jgi:rfaE bifunctional protein kinase chain/domain